MRDEVVNLCMQKLSNSGQEDYLKSRSVWEHELRERREEKELLEFVEDIRQKKTTLPPSHPPLTLLAEASTLQA